MPRVETVPHPGIERHYTDQALQLFQAIGKKPTMVIKKCPKFVANRLQAAICDEAYSLVQRGVVTAEELCL